MRARAHQGELDLVLDIFDMKGASGRLAPHQRSDHGFSQARNEFPNPRRGRPLPAFDGQKRLGHGHRDLAGLKTHYGAIAPNDPVLRKLGLRDGRADVGEAFRARNRLGSPRVSGNLHVRSPQRFSFVGCPTGPSGRQYAWPGN